MECIKCKITDSESYINCDGCERAIHAQCSGLNATELKVMGLRGRRGLRFYCDDCALGVKLVPKLIKKIDDLQIEIETLKTQMRDISNKQVSVSAPTEINDEVANEIIERQKRSNNVVIFNLPENNENSDIIKTQELFHTLTKQNLSIQKTFRTGKKNRNGHRALKVILTNSDDALKIIKSNKRILTGRNVYVSADLTQSQRLHLTTLRQEVSDRNGKGENLVIKYINGLPQIKEGPPKNATAATSASTTAT